MTLVQLLFDDEGVITRRQWWLGTIMLVVFQFLAEYLASRQLLSSGLYRPVMLFVSITVLIPYYSVNAKRFRAIGSRPELALIGGILPLIAVLSDTFLGFKSFDLVLGLLILAVILWYVLDLGVIAHEAIVDVSRRQV
ncbi:MAG: hypothetical protein ACKVON_01655 [Beijerinckiaceae bacterium]